MTVPTNTGTNSQVQVHEASTGIALTIVGEPFIADFTQATTTGSIIVLDAETQNILADEHTMHLLDEAQADIDTQRLVDGGDLRSG